MKYTLITLILMILASIYIAKITIHFSPFRISFERPLLGWGLFLLFLGFFIFSVGVYEIGAEDGKNETNNKEAHK